MITDSEKLKTGMFFDELFKLKEGLQKEIAK